MFIKSKGHPAALRGKVILIAVLFLVILLISWFNSHSDWVEGIYAQGLYPALGSFLRLLLGWIPFSIGDLFYLAALALLLLQFWRLLKGLVKQNYRATASSLLNIVISLECGLIIFYLFWGINYFRYSTARRLDLEPGAYQTEELLPVAQHLVEKANYFREQINEEALRQLNNKEVYQMAGQAYEQLGKKQPAFHIARPGLKPALFTPLINFMGVSGYFNPFTGEAQLNYAMPNHLKPFVACHEIAHQAGFGPEDAASFAGFLAGIQSDNAILQYSVYYTALKDILRVLSRREREHYLRLYESVSPAIKQDMQEEYEYWLYYRGAIDHISAFFYDHFLKANNQPKGLKTYNEMIRLLVAWYQKEGAGRHHLESSQP